MRYRFKVCCIKSVEEARLAIAAGADALGLVGKMPTGPGPLPDDEIATIARVVPPAVDAWLLTSEDTAEAIAAHVDRTGVRTVQLVRHVEPGVHAALRKLRPHVRLVQVVHVEGEWALQLAASYARTADALLLDSGRPADDILGGVGVVHDWGLSGRIVRETAIPVFLAGGLQANNLEEAARRVAPFGFDLCSGIRTDGALDAGKLAAFAKAVGRAERRAVDPR